MSRTIDTLRDVVRFQYDELRSLGMAPDRAKSAACAMMARKRGLRLADALALLDSTLAAEAQSTHRRGNVAAL